MFRYRIALRPKKFRDRRCESVRALCAIIFLSRRWPASPIAPSGSCAKGSAQAWPYPRWWPRTPCCGAARRRAAARFNVERGAQIVDINMGCPAKKVCNTLAGSALLKDEPLVGRILKAVVKAVNVPVTLKFRTGWDPVNKNALMVAKIAEDSGVQLLSLHGRTRACGFSGRAEYDTIREVKRSTRLPVVANGDITTPEEAKHVLEYTGADGIMIGRAAQGRPWIFREIEHYLSTGEKLPDPLNFAEDP